MSHTPLIAPRDPSGITMRQIVLEGIAVDYRLVRVRRRSIGMIINREGLSVRAARWVPIREIESALAARAAWIVATLRECHGCGIRALPAHWRQGAEVLLRGRPLALALVPARKASIRADLFNLTVLHPAPGDESAIAGFVTQWLRDEALAMLSGRVAHFARRLARPAPRVRLSNARTQWGSCNHHGDIRLHWRLVQIPPHLADYVAAHEVAHLVELNHSQRFWRLVATLVPDYAAARDELDALTRRLA